MSMSCSSMAGRVLNSIGNFEHKVNEPHPVIVQKDMEIGKLNVEIKESMSKMVNTYIPNKSKIK